MEMTPACRMSFRTQVQRQTETQTQTQTIPGQLAQCRTVLLALSRTLALWLVKAESSLQEKNPKPKAGLGKGGRSQTIRAGTSLSGKQSQVLA